MKPPTLQFNHIYVRKQDSCTESVLGGRPFHKICRSTLNPDWLHFSEPNALFTTPPGLTFELSLLCARRNPNYILQISRQNKPLHQELMTEVLILLFLKIQNSLCCSEVNIFLTASLAAFSKNSLLRSILEPARRQRFSRLDFGHLKGQTRERRS
jgi:hypothetical protein